MTDLICLSRRRWDDVDHAALIEAARSRRVFFVEESEGPDLLSSRRTPEGVTIVAARAPAIDDTHVLDRVMDAEQIEECTIRFAA